MGGASLLHTPGRLPLLTPAIRCVQRPASDPPRLHASPLGPGAGSTSTRCLGPSNPLYHIRAASHGTVIEWHELPHEQVCDSFGRWVAERVLGAKTFIEQIEQLADSSSAPMGRERERVSHPQVVFHELRRVQVRKPRRVANQRLIDLPPRWLCQTLDGPAVRRFEIGRLPTQDFGELGLYRVEDTLLTQLHQFCQIR